MNWMRIRDLENELSAYVSEWVDARWVDWNIIRSSISLDKILIVLGWSKNLTD